MGGSGSGWHRSSRSTVEDGLVLSAAKLQRDRMLAAGHRWSGVLTWRNTYTGETRSTVGLESDLGPACGVITLSHRRARDPNDAGQRYPVWVTSTPLPWCGAGGTRGRRWWFTCPLSVGGRPCGRRCGKLYLPPGGQWFGCRRCYNLTYSSCRESHRADAVMASIGREFGLSAAQVRRALKW